MIVALGALTSPANSYAESFEAQNDAPQSVRVDVSGWVASRCGFAEGRAPGDDGSIVIDLEAVGRVPFGVDCNVPFRVRVTTREGGLRHASGALSAAARQAGYQDLIAYRVDLSVERDAGGALTDSCVSTDMVSGAACRMSTMQGLASQTTARNQPAFLLVQTELVDRDRLLAGTYADIITVEVSP